MIELVSTNLDNYMDILISYFLANPLLWSALLIFSAFSFFFTLIAAPLVIMRIPYNYFTRSQRTPMILTESHPVVYGLFLCLKNLLGILFVLMGILMLVLPGQGILTIVVGILMLNFPGKYQLERKLIQQKTIFNGLNWIRKKGKQPPLEKPLTEPKTERYNQSGV